jgi:hypothetical protein
MGTAEQAQSLVHDTLAAAMPIDERGRHIDAILNSLRQQISGACPC